MIKILVSACLLGQPVRYNGSAAPCQSTWLEEWVAGGQVAPFCPEIAAGLPVPRLAAEIRGGDGWAVLAGNAAVVQADGCDVTAVFRQAADCTLAVARREGVRLAILKEGSPSCGCHRISDGTFSGTRIAGQGVTAARLIEGGLPVFSEAEIQQARAWLAGAAG